MWLIMKVIVLIFGLLAQTFAASLYDEFRGAMSNVERGFGKIITDVVADVKDTIHCTLSTVEQVLAQKGVLNTYNYRCREITKRKNVPFYRSQIDRLRNFNNPSRDEFTSRQTSMKLGSSISNTDKSINNILNHPINVDITHPSEVLQAETHELVEISDTLRKELERFSTNTNAELRYTVDRSNGVGSLWNNIKTLHNVQRKSRNDAEVKDIRHVLDENVNRFNLPDYRNKEDNYNMGDIQKHLKRFSDETNSLHTYDHEIESLGLNEARFSSQSSEAIHTVVINNIEHKTPKTIIDGEISVFHLDSDAFKHFSPFSSNDPNYNESINNAKNIIQDSKRTDEILNRVFQNTKAGSNVFSNAKLFKFK